MENNKKIYCYDLEVEDNDDTKVEFVSMVYEAATDLNYVAFSKDKPELKPFQFKIKDEAKRMLTGVFMKANLMIERFDKETNEKYFVRFSADAIEKARNKFFKNGYQKNVDSEHNHNINGSYVVDSWIIRDEDSNPLKSYGFNDIGVGDWVGTVFVENEEVWNEWVETGKLRGFSVDGLFRFGKKTLVETFGAQSLESTDNGLSKEENEMINKIAKFLSEDENIL